MNFTREELDAHMEAHGFQPVETSVPEYINYQKMGYFGTGSATCLSVMLSPDILSEVESPAQLLLQIMSSMART